MLSYNISEFILSYIKTLFFLIWEFFNEFADCRFWNLYVALDFAHNFVAYGRNFFQKFENIRKVEMELSSASFCNSPYQPTPLPTKKVTNKMGIYSVQHKFCLAEGVGVKKKIFKKLLSCVFLGCIPNFNVQLCMELEKSLWCGWWWWWCGGGLSLF